MFASVAHCMCRVVFQELIEFARQARRWTVGTAESFHYLCVKWRSLPVCCAIRFAVIFSHYYGFVLCAMSLFNVAALVSTIVFNCTGVCTPSEFLFSMYLNYIPLIGVPFCYLMFAWCFVLDRAATRLMQVDEQICWLRNLLHWLSSPMVLVAYSCVGFFAICEVAVRGKKACTHGASKKDAFVDIV